jgi:hypothetical protein
MNLENGKEAKVAKLSAESGEKVCPRANSDAYRVRVRTQQTHTRIRVWVLTAGTCTSLGRTVAGIEITRQVDCEQVYDTHALPDH